jgi:hypothetical protein
MSASHQPDDDNAGPNCSSSTQAQDLFGRLRRCREQPDAQLWCGSPQQTFEYENQADSHEQITHRLG